jgi:hypothetical protein
MKEFSERRFGYWCPGLVFAVETWAEGRAVDWWLDDWSWPCTIAIMLHLLDDRGEPAWNLIGRRFDQIRKARGVVLTNCFTYRPGPRAREHLDRLGMTVNGDLRPEHGARVISDLDGVLSAMIDHHRQHGISRREVVRCSLLARHRGSGSSWRKLRRLLK